MSLHIQTCFNNILAILQRLSIVSKTDVCRYVVGWGLKFNSTHGRAETQDGYAAKGTQIAALYTCGIEYYRICLHFHFFSHKNQYMLLHRLALVRAPDVIVRESGERFELSSGV